MSRSSVVLPHPEGPSSAVKLPAGTCRSTPVRTVVVPNDFATACTDNALMRA